MKLSIAACFAALGVMLVCSATSASAGYRDGRYYGRYYRSYAYSSPYYYGYYGPSRAYAGRDVYVAAPATRVYVAPYAWGGGVHVRAPYANVWVGW
jgi:hypothetical protein